MADVVFVREIAGGRDLVLAIDHDGRPAWALDLDRDLQWWYPGGDTPGVREAIASARPSFATLPVAAVTPAQGPHPAIELGRRAEAAASPSEAAPPGDDLVSLLAQRWSRLSRAARLGITVLALAALVILLSTALGGVAGAPPAQLPVSDDGMTVTSVETAGTPCPTRGLIAYDADRQRLVCVPPSRAMPSDLEWRPVG
ncbi:MAG TPA: hypothetical protein VFL59_05985 [Candidatus Nanopelagicales bacterium]|nr:hypothetical protein [Candidatus Nanopelagicales bacterium]